MEDFLSAGQINAGKRDFPEVFAKNENLYKKLGKIWEISETKYEEYISEKRCLFLKNNICTIYKIRPKGCHAFPNTILGMESKDCEPLLRLNQMLKTLKKGRKIKTTKFFSRVVELSINQDKPIEPQITKKEFEICVTKLHKAGMTNEEFAHLKYLNYKS